MKKAFSFLLLLGLMGSIMSQVVITHNSHAPVKGTQNTYCGLGFLDPGESGKNVIWDFSQAQQNEALRQTSFNIAESTDIENFSLETTCVLIEDNNRYFQNLNSTSYAITGFINDDFIIYYSEPFVKMIYPFSYTDKFEGSLSATALNNKNSVTEIEGNYSFSADAYGKIVLPGNIVKNVLRVYQHSTSVQVSFCREVNIETIKYMWYSADGRYPIVSTIIQEKRFSNGDVQKTEETWVNQKYIKSDSQNLEEISLGDKFNVQVFPNPFADETELILNLNVSAKVEVHICNVFGTNLKILQELEYLEKGQYFYKVNSFDLALPPGMYFVNIWVDNQHKSVKLIRK